MTPAAKSTPSTTIGALQLCLEPLAMNRSFIATIRQKAQNLTTMN